MLLRLIHGSRKTFRGYRCFLALIVEPENARSLFPAVSLWRRRGGIVVGVRERRDSQLEMIHSTTQRNIVPPFRLDDVEMLVKYSFLTAIPISFNCCRRCRHRTDY